MIIKSTSLTDVYEIENKIFEDDRGSFVKTFHTGIFKEKGLTVDFKESFYSVSKKDVLRGMHFQLPPHDHAKLVYVTSGEIVDVVVNIDKDSAEFGKYYSTKLSANNAKSLYIGNKYAHGFLTLSNQATVVYMTSVVHSPKYDTGVLWSSFNFDWKIKSPLLSERDIELPSLGYF